MKEHARAFSQMTREEFQTRQQVSKAGPVVLPDAVEHHSPGRHVHSHSKRLGSKQHLGDEDVRFRRILLTIYRLDNWGSILSNRHF